MIKKHNYRKKIEKMVKDDKLDTTPGVYIMHIFHDDWCNFLKGGKCNCNPDIVQDLIRDKTDKGSRQ